MVDKSETIYYVSGNLVYGESQRIEQGLKLEKTESCIAAVYPDEKKNQFQVCVKAGYSKGNLAKELGLESDKISIYPIKEREYGISLHPGDVNYRTILHKLVVPGLAKCIYGDGKCIIRTHLIEPEIAKILGIDESCINVP